MKVAILLSCSSFEGFFGGVQRQTRQSYLASYRGDWSWYYAQGLLENGVEPILYIPSRAETGLHETDTGVSVRFLPLRRWYAPMENAWVKRLSRQSRWTLYADERVNTVAMHGSLRRALQEDGIDALYVQEYWSGRFDHLAHRVPIPMVAADHGGLSTRVVKVFKKSAFAAVPFVYAQTPDECAIVADHGGTARLHPNGCDTRFFKPADDGVRVKSILTVARLTNKQKRTSDLIKALTLLPADWRLDIVGTGPDQTMLKELAGTLKVADRVIFHGFLGRSQVRDMLQRCGVFSMPSSNEAVAIAALEAMSCGASVVLSRIRAFEQLVSDGENGALIEVGDAQGLASAIAQAWANRVTRGSAARRTICERFDSAALNRELARSLKSLKAGRPRQSSREAADSPHASFAHRQ